MFSLSPHINSERMLLELTDSHADFLKITERSKIRVHHSEQVMIANYMHKLIVCRNIVEQ